jgi:hypothetical protein
MAAVESISGVPLGGVYKALSDAASRAGRQCMKHVDCDAQGRDPRDRGCKELDWSSELPLLSTETFHSALIGFAVVGGKLVVAPGTG